MPHNYIYLREIRDAAIVCEFFERCYELRMDIVNKTAWQKPLERKLLVLRSYKIMLNY